MPIDEAASASLSSAGKAQPAHDATMQSLVQLLQGAMGATPGKTVSQIQFPSNVGEPPPSYKSPGAAEIPQGSFQTSGERHRAYAQSALNNLASFAKSGSDLIHQRKVRDYQGKIEKIMQAQTGLQEAQAMLKDNPNDPEAKQAMQQNQTILQDIYSDPKNSKMLEKAFNVKLIGDDKGKASPEYQALIAAKKANDKAAQQKAGQAMMEKAQKQMPIVQGMNPQMMMQAQMIKAGLAPGANEKLKATEELVKTIQTSYDKGEDRAARTQIADGLIKAKDRATQASLLRTVKTNEGKLGVAKVLGQYGVKKAQIAADTALQNDAWRMGLGMLKNMTEQNKTATNNKTLSVLNQEAQRVNDRLKNAQAELKKLDDDSWFHKPSTYKRIDELNKEIKEAKEDQQRVINKMSQLNNLGLSAGGDGTEKSEGQPAKDDFNIEELYNQITGGMGEDESDPE